MTIFRSALPSALRLAAIALAVAIAGGAAAQSTPPPMLDPWVPPSQRKAAVRPPAAGADLRAQVERKLRANFDAADTTGAGSITRAQAQAAGLGFVANHFDRIDAGATGRVTFDDLKRYLRAQGAEL